MLLESEMNTVCISQTLKRDFPVTARRLEEILEDHFIPTIWIPNTKDIWCRDYMPVQVRGDKFIQFVYDPDYITKGAQNYKTTASDLKPFLRGVIHRPVFSSTLKIDGGNVVSAGDKVFLTAKVFAENPTVSRQDIMKRLEMMLQAIPVIFPIEPEDVVGHTDGMVRYIGNNIVLINDYKCVGRSFRDLVRHIVTSWGLNYREIPYFLDDPKNNIDHVVGSAVGNYINYLRVRSLIVVPQFGVDQDRKALRVISEVHPGCVVRGVDFRQVARHGGLCNCVSWTIKV